MLNQLSKKPYGSSIGQLNGCVNSNFYAVSYIGNDHFDIIGP
jgi:hypothetical protein